MAVSVYQYSRFGLGVDFSTSNQAAFLIAHGHLDPYVTTHRYPYLDDHFGLLLYPMAAFYLVYPHGILLLWFQDLASVAAELVTLLWVTEIVARRSSPDDSSLAGPAIVVGAVVLLIADPWFYTSILFDFHLNAFAALFLVLAARDAWNGRLGRASAFSVALLLTGDTGGLYLAGLGFSMAVGATGKRKFGAAALVVGAVWVVVVHVIAVNQSHVLVASYTYLVTGSPLVPGTITLFSVSKALIEHPHRWLQMLWGRKRIIYEILVPSGVVGIFSPWAFGTDFAVFFLQATAYSLTFLVDGFNVFPGLALVLACSVMALCEAAFSPRRWMRRAGCVVGLGLVVQSLVFAAVKIPEQFDYFLRISSPQAAALDRGLALTPGDAEVIASWGVMGRFSGRQWDYPLYSGVEADPVRARNVVFVLTDAGLENDSPRAVAAIGAFVRDKLNAKVLVDSAGVTVLEWHAPAGTTQVPIPNPTGAVP